MSAQANPVEDRPEVLAVEDSPTQAERLRYLLEQHHYRVTGASSGKQALAFLGERKPALVVSDIVMPEMNGYELCQRIKSDERTQDVPVILLTSLSGSEDVLEGLACGADRFITKPFSEDYLLSQVEQVLGSKRLRKGVRVRVEVTVAEKQRFISADQQQMLSLLISSYEAAVHRNIELVQAQDELSSLNEHLEELVEERTAALSAEIAERKQAEEALTVRSEELVRSNRDLEQFAYVATHDLQEPLRMVSSYLQLLEHRYKGKLDSNADTFIGYAVEGASRMKQLIGDLLAYSRVSTRGRELVPTDCNAVLDHVLANLQIAIQDSQASVTHEPLPTVQGDSAQLEQLFQNLVANAIKFHGDQPPEVRIAARREGREWVFSVRDNGIGIDPKYFERIFVIFQRLHTREEYPGTGIGLAVAKRIVERHGGRMWVESEPGQGATFFFTLPAQGR